MMGRKHALAKGGLLAVCLLAILLSTALPSLAANEQKKYSFQYEVVFLNVGPDLAGSKYQARIVMRMESRQINGQYVIRPNLKLDSPCQNQGLQVELGFAKDQWYQDIEAYCKNKGLTLKTYTDVTKQPISVRFVDQIGKTVKLDERPLLEYGKISDIRSFRKNNGFVFQHKGRFEARKFHGITRNFIYRGLYWEPNKNKKPVTSCTLVVQAKPELIDKSQKVISHKQNDPIGKQNGAPAVDKDKTGNKGAASPDSSKGPQGSAAQKKFIDGKTPGAKASSIGEVNTPSPGGPGLAKPKGGSTAEGQIAAGSPGAGQHPGTTPTAPLESPGTQAPSPAVGPQAVVLSWPDQETAANYEKVALAVFTPEGEWRQGPLVFVAGAKPLQLAWPSLPDKAPANIMVWAWPKKSWFLSDEPRPEALFISNLAHSDYMLSMDPTAPQPLLALVSHPFSIKLEFQGRHPGPASVFINFMNNKSQLLSSWRGQLTTERNAVAVPGNFLTTGVHLINLIVIPKDASSPWAAHSLDISRDTIEKHIAQKDPLIISLAPYKTISPEPILGIFEVRDDGDRPVANAKVGIMSDPGRGNLGWGTTGNDGQVLIPLQAGSTNQKTMVASKKGYKSSIDYFLPGQQLKYRLRLELDLVHSNFSMMLVNQLTGKQVIPATGAVGSLTVGGKTEKVKMSPSGYFTFSLPVPRQPGQLFTFNAIAKDYEVSEALTLKMPANITGNTWAPRDLKLQVAPTSKGLLVLINDANNWKWFTPARDTAQESLLELVRKGKTSGYKIIAFSTLLGSPLVLDNVDRGLPEDQLVTFFQGMRGIRKGSNFAQRRELISIIDRFKNLIGQAGKWKIVLLLGYNLGLEPTLSPQDRENLIRFKERLAQRQINLVIIESQGTRKYLQDFFAASPHAYFYTGVDKAKLEVAIEEAIK